MATEKFDWASVGGYPADEPIQNKPKSSVLDQIAEFLSGAGLGIAQGGSDIGANIAQFPSDVYTYFTGKPGYTAPKPDIRSWGPQSETGKSGESIGEFVAPFAFSPGLALETKLGNAAFGGRLLPRLASESLLGSAESENRGLGLGLGALTPAAGKAIRFAKETPFTKAGAVKKMNKARQLAGEESLGIPLDMDFLRNLEYQLGSSHLKPSKMAINNLLGEATKGDYPSYFNLQSALGDIGRELMNPSPQRGKGLGGLISQYLNPPQTSAVERLTGQQINQLQNKYIQDAMEHLTKTGRGDIAKLTQEGRRDYSNFKRFEPWRNRVGWLLAGGIPGANYISHLFHHD